MSGALEARPNFTASALSSTLSARIWFFFKKPCAAPSLLYWISPSFSHPGSTVLLMPRASLVVCFQPGTPTKSDAELFILVLESYFRILSGVSHIPYLFSIYMVPIKTVRGQKVEYREGKRTQSGIYMLCFSHQWLPQYSQSDSWWRS